MQKVRIGISGLGRLGVLHAENLAFTIGRCELVAACDSDGGKRQWAKDYLGVKNTYTDFQQMCLQDDIQAIFSVAPTMLHGEQITTALAAGKHVFCEKPLGMSMQECQHLEKVRQQYPDQVCMIGFMRRYDPAYQRAKEKLDHGEIGKPFFFQSCTGDMNHTAAFQIQFATKSGGIFIDMALHDVDILHWFSGSKMKRIFSLGGAYCHPDFATHGDCDNALVLAENEDGSMAMIKVSRTDVYGDSTQALIQGPKGMLHINNRSRRDQLDEYVEGRIQTTCSQHFSQRFKEAFVLEASAFIDHITTGTHPEMTLADATYATQGALACKLALQRQAVVHLEEVMA